MTFRRIGRVHSMYTILMEGPIGAADFAVDQNLPVAPQQAILRSLEQRRLSSVEYILRNYQEADFDDPCVSDLISLQIKSLWFGVSEPEEVAALVQLQIKRKKHVSAEWWLAWWSILKGPTATACRRLILSATSVNDFLMRQFLVHSIENEDTESAQMVLDAMTVPLTADTFWSSVVPQLFRKSPETIKWTLRHGPPISYHVFKLRCRIYGHNECLQYHPDHEILPRGLAPFTGKTPVSATHGNGGHSKWMFVVIFLFCVTLAIERCM